MPLNRGDDGLYVLALNLSMSGPPVALKGGEYTLFIDSSINSGTLALQQQSPSGAWINCQAYGLQYVKTTDYAVCILGLPLGAGVYRLNAKGVVLNLNSYLVGNG